MDAAISLQSLSFAYGRETVLSDCSLHVKKGSIHGLLGQNGAGKTTLMKILLGLLPPGSGSVAVFGMDIREQPEAILRRCGSLLELPRPYPLMTARDYLRLKQLCLGLPPAVIGQKLALTGLSHAADKPCGKLSLGMRQRLCLAFALLNEPELLILDEPTNGLDPSGIREIRELIRYLAAEEGKTILLSSHLLSEAGRLCDTISILHEGRILPGNQVDGEAEDLLLYVRTDATGIAATLLALPDAQHLPDSSGEWLRLPIATEADIPGIIRTLTDKGVAIYAVKQEARSLEEQYLAITSKKEGQGV